MSTPLLHFEILRMEKGLTPVGTEEERLVLHKNPSFLTQSQQVDQSIHLSWGGMTEKRTQEWYASGFLSCEKNRKYIPNPTATHTHTNHRQHSLPTKLLVLLKLTYSIKPYLTPRHILPSAHITFYTYKFINSGTKTITHKAQRIQIRKRYCFCPQTLGETMSMTASLI